MARRKKGVRVVCLLEDETLERFTRKVLKRFGFTYREIRVVPGYPSSGQGSAKQWVDNRYPEEVNTHRAKAHHQRIALLVCTDADELSVRDRARRLAEKLRTAEMPHRGERERIGHWIPKWSVETWGLYLSGQDVSEDERYKGTAQANDIDWNHASGRFVAECEASGENGIDTLDSLRQAYEETGRMGV